MSHVLLLLENIDFTKPTLQGILTAIVSWRMHIIGRCPDSVLKHQSLGRRFTDRFLTSACYRSWFCSWNFWQSPCRVWCKTFQVISTRNIASEFGRQASCHQKVSVSKRRLQVKVIRRILRRGSKIDSNTCTDYFWSFVRSFFQSHYCSRTFFFIGFAFSFHLSHPVSSDQKKS